MGFRGQPIDSEAAGFERSGKRQRTVEDTLVSRALPPGYVFNIVDGDLVITRQADGATSTMVFA